MHWIHIQDWTFWPVRNSFKQSLFSFQVAAAMPCVWTGRHPTLVERFPNSSSRSQMQFFCSHFKPDNDTKTKYVYICIEKEVAYLPHWTKSVQYPLQKWNQLSICFFFPNRKSLQTYLKKAHCHHQGLSSERDFTQVKDIFIRQGRQVQCAIWSTYIWLCLRMGCNALCHDLFESVAVFLVC